MLRIFAALISLVLGCADVFAQDAPTNSTKPFLSEYAQKITAQAGQIRAESLRAMLLTPRIMPLGESESTVTLTPDQSKQLLALLNESRDFDPGARLSSCHYEPGVRLLFYPPSKKGPKDLTDTDRPDQPQLSILLCFNCDVWAIGKGDYSETFAKKIPMSIGAFGDSRPQRAQLQALIQSILGKNWASN